MICAHNYVRNFNFVPRIWSRPHDKDCLYILSSSNNSFSFILTSRDNTLSHSLHCALQRQHSLSVSVSLPLYLFWLPKTTLSFILLHFNFQRQHSLSLFLHFRLPETAWPCHLVKTQLNTRNVGAYTFCNLFLSCSAFSVRLFPVSNTASEISLNPERDKQPTWEKTPSS